jgi:hypothetical protein
VERSSSPLRRRALAGAQSRLICRRRSMSSAACRTRRQHADPCSNQVSAVTSRAGGGRTNGFEPIVQTFDCVSRFAVPHPGKCSAGRSCPEQAWRASSSTRSVVRSTDSSRVLRHSPKYASRGKPRTRPQRKQIIHGHSNVRWPLATCFAREEGCRGPPLTGPTSPTLTGFPPFCPPRCAGTTPCIATDTGRHRGRVLANIFPITRPKT